MIDLFREPSGAIDWLSFLSVDELLERGRSLLAVGISGGALDALEAVPAARRDLDWVLLQVEALTLARRGDQALALVGTVGSSDRGQLIRIAELRAAALLEAARARSGRPLPPAAERERLRAEARQALWQVLELAGEDPAHRQAAVTAHRRLLSLLLDRS